jgi:hypothetical protein
MRDGDEEIGGKHIDPVSIQLLGEKGESAKLIGMGRKLLGNLKARVGEGSSKQVLSGNYKYEASLEELTRWGRPVLGKLNPLQLYEDPENVPYVVDVQWEITTKTMMSGQQTDIDKLKIKTEVGYNLAKHEIPQEESPLKEDSSTTEEPLPVGRRVLGYIVQAFSSDVFGEGEDNTLPALDMVLTTPQSQQLLIKAAAQVPLETLGSPAYKGFSDYGAHYAVSRDYPELQVVLSTQQHGYNTYTLNGPMQCTPAPGSSAVEDYTWVWSHQTSSGICGWHPVIGDLHYTAVSFWGLKTQWHVEPALLDENGDGYWGGSINYDTNSPGLLYSGPWYPDAILGASCDRDSVIPQGQSYTNAFEYKRYMVETQECGPWNQALKQSFDSYTASMKNTSSDSYSYTRAQVPMFDGPTMGGFIIVRRADGHGFGILGGFELIGRKQVVFHDQTEGYGQGAIFMMPDPQVKISYTYSDAIHAAVAPPTQHKQNVNVGTINYSAYEGSGVEY